jgi:hypothetical protein
MVRLPIGWHENRSPTPVVSKNRSRTANEGRQVCLKRQAVAVRLAPAVTSSHLMQSVAGTCVISALPVPMEYDDVDCASQ